MAKILCVGIATLDIVNEVAVYPAEDDESRILAQDKCRGGNAANTSVVLSQLGHECYWAGTLVAESDCQIILDDFGDYQINIDYAQFLAQGKVPTSYISVSRETASRTISHYRDLPEYCFSEFQKINLHNFDWLHFEGRNIEHTDKMIRYAKQNYPQLRISVELEKPREGIDRLIEFADIIIFSKYYALSNDFHSAVQFLQQFKKQNNDKAFICAWGSAGAAALFKQQDYWQDAVRVEAIDTLAAGDVFNAAIIDQQIQQNNIARCLQYACQLAAEKCTRKGLRLV